MTLRQWFFVAFLGLLTTMASAQVAKKSYFSWSELPALPVVSNQVDVFGVAGPFVGVHQDALIIAGGANFDKPYWENKAVAIKEWHQTIWVMTKDGQWHSGGSLPKPIAYGASVSTAEVFYVWGETTTQTQLMTFFSCNGMQPQKK